MDAAAWDALQVGASRIIGNPSLIALRQSGPLIRPEGLPRRGASGQQKLDHAFIGVDGLCI
ncbi:MAG: hypothetical protein DMG54_31075 [Acidobacteria bacterium]|nr:MAG: hypothetical protein DMG54_31075 [Acidobacteriota bacterium]PYU70564.1 MAG: hypothetical protein DMG52_25360 [Acidobacteriota bacterium]